MKLQYKFTLPIIITLILAFSALTTTSFLFSQSLINDNIVTITNSKIQEAEMELNTRVNEINNLKNELNQQYITKAKMISFLMIHDPEIINNIDDLKQLTKTLDIEEIHITDEKGVLQWGTVPEFYGFDFSTSDQAKAFLPALTDKSFVLPQEPSERGVDKVLFQYIGVARLDKPGVVQIGVKPERLQQALASDNITQMSKGLTFGNSGSILIIDKNSELVISHKDDKEIGKSAKDYSFFKDIQGKSNGNVNYSINGTKKILSFKIVGDNIICAAIEEKEFNSGLKSLLSISIIITIAAIILSSFVAFILLRFNIIKEIDKILAVLKHVGEGNLKHSIKVKSSKELGELSDGINNMLDNLKSMMSKNINMTSALSNVADKLSVSADHSNKVAQEVAITINELAVGAGEQAENSSRGAELTRETFNQLEAISSDIGAAAQNTSIASKAVENGMQSIVHQSSSMDKNVESVKKVNDTVNELAAKTEEIGNIISVITGIASQTNMLALNAAIEAARAGEAGRGFAVVADEVRKLAESSTSSAQKIADIISEIQHNIDNAKLQANESILTVAEQQKSVEHTKKSFEAISISTSSTLMQINSVKTSADEMLKSVDSMVQMIEATAATAEQSAAGTEEISASTEEQSATMEEVSQIAKRLKEMVVELSSSSKGFQI